MTVNVKQLRKKPYDKNSRAEILRRTVQDEQLKNQYGPELEAQKSIAGDLKNLSDQHKDLSLSIQDSEDAKKVLRTEAKLWMQKPEYKLPQGDVVGDRTRAYMSKLFEDIEGDGMPEDRDLNPSGGAPLHFDGKE